MVLADEKLLRERNWSYGYVPGQGLRPKRGGQAGTTRRSTLPESSTTALHRASRSSRYPAPPREPSGVNLSAETGRLHLGRKNFAERRTGAGRLTPADRRMAVDRRMAAARRLTVDRGTRPAQAVALSLRPNRVILPLLLFILGLALFMAWRQTTIVRVGYEIDQLKNQVALVRAERDRLQLEVTRLESLDRIEKVATERLGMVRPIQARAYVPVPSTIPQVGLRQPGWWEKITSYLAGKLAGLKKAEAKEVR